MSLINGSVSKNERNQSKIVATIAAPTIEPKLKNKPLIKFS